MHRKSIRPAPEVKKKVSCKADGKTRQRPQDKGFWQGKISAGGGKTCSLLNDKWWTGNAGETSRYWLIYYWPRIFLWTFLWRRVLYLTCHTRQINHSSLGLFNQRQEGLSDVNQSPQIDVCDVLHMFQRCPFYWRDGKNSGIVHQSPHAWNYVKWRVNGRFCTSRRIIRLEG